MHKLYNVKQWGSIAPAWVLKELRVPYENALITPERVQKSEFRLTGLQAMRSP